MINLGGFLQTSTLTVFTLCSRVLKRNAPSLCGYAHCLLCVRLIVFLFCPVRLHLLRNKLYIWQIVNYLKIRCLHCTRVQFKTWVQLVWQESTTTCVRVAW